MLLLARTVPVNKLLLAGTVPVNKLLLAWTVQVNKFLLAGTPKKYKFQKFPHPSKYPPIVPEFWPEVEGNFVQWGEPVPCNSATLVTELSLISLKSK